MAQPGNNRPRWTYYPLKILPGSLDIVWCRFPELELDSPGPKSRPGLVHSVRLNKAHTVAQVEVSYGTSKLKLQQRQHDLIIENHTQLNLMGLPQATRFDLDNVLWLPWAKEFFECRRGFDTPVIGTLTNDAKIQLEILKVNRRKPRKK